MRFENILSCFFRRCFQTHTSIRLLPNGCMTVILMLFTCTAIGAPVEPWPFYNLEPNDPPALTQAQKDSSLYKAGYISVAWYGAIPNDGIDDTAAIQSAINDARDYMYVCYMPIGDYTISDTLNMKEELYLHPSNGNTVNGMWKPCVLVGEKNSTGKARLVLSATATGFGDIANLKPLIQVWIPNINTVPTPTTIDGEEGGINFNQMVRNLELDISAGNNIGAVAIRCHSAQGTTIEDIRIIATGAFAGIMNSVGAGGGLYNLEIEGGKYGIYLEKTAHATYAGITFKNQTDAAYYHKAGFTAPTIVGFKVIKDKGPAFVVDANSSDWVIRGLTLVDGVVEFTSVGATGRAVINDGNETVSMRNVYFKNVDEIIKSGTAAAVPGSSNWTKVSEYTYCFLVGNTQQNLFQNRDYYNLIDGVSSNSEIIKKEDNTLAPPKDILLKHIWSSLDFPSFEDIAVVNVKDLGAVGDGIADDTAALQDAFLNYKRVFLPRGTYLIRNTITLGKDTQVFGTHKTMVQIRADYDNWVGGGPTTETTMIQTEDAADGTAILAHLLLNWPANDATKVIFNLLDWRVGRASIVRDICSKRYLWTATDSNNLWRMFKITGNGGGRWYALYAMNYRHALNEGYRSLYIDGTTEPLSFYSLNIERSHKENYTLPNRYQTEIVNARNIDIYYYKTEGNQTSLRINNCKNVKVWDEGGLAATWEGKATIDVNNSDDILIANASSQFKDPADVPYGQSFNDAGAGINVDPALAYMVKEDYFGVINSQLRSVPMGIFKRGNGFITTQPNEPLILWEDCSVANPDFTLDSNISFSGGTLQCSSNTDTQRALWGNRSMGKIKVELKMKVNVFGGTTSWKVPWVKIARNPDDARDYITCYVAQNNKWTLEAKIDNVPVLTSAPTITLASFDPYIWHDYTLQYDGYTITAYLDGANKLTYTITDPVVRDAFNSGILEFSFISTTSEIKDIKVTHIDSRDYFEDFNDNIADNWSAQDIYMGMYRKNGPQTYNGGDVKCGDNFTLSADMVLVDTDADYNVPRLIFKYADAQNYYMARIESNGKLRVYRVENSIATLLNNPSPDVSNYLNKDPLTGLRSLFGINKLKVEVRKNAIKVFVNDQSDVGLEMTDSRLTQVPYQNGKLGCFNTLYVPGVKEMYVDNIEFRTLYGL